MARVIIRATITNNGEVPANLLVMGIVDKPDGTADSTSTTINLAPKSSKDVELTIYNVPLKAGKYKFRVEVYDRDQRKKVAYDEVEKTFSYKISVKITKVEVR